MSQNKYGLSGRPRVSVRHIRSRPIRKTSKANSSVWQFALLGVFLAGALMGGGIVANDKLSQADQLAQNQIQTQTQGQVASAVTTEPWSKPLEYSTEDLNVVADMLPILIEEARHQPTAEELANQKRRADLRAYFESRKSPFADDDATLDAFLNSSNMKLMIAISFVESTMGKKCYYKNCSGIGGYPPNLRKYESYADWVRDFDSLLERRYKGMDPEDMMGVYVQPGSPNWINGVRQILAELKAQGIE
jgi:hypothetical protein